MKKTVALWWLFASFVAHAQDARAPSRVGLEASDGAVGFQWLDESDGSRLSPAKRATHSRGQSVFISGTQRLGVGVRSFSGATLSRLRRRMAEADRRRHAGRAHLFERRTRTLDGSAELRGAASASGSRRRKRETAARPIPADCHRRRHLLRITDRVLRARRIPRGRGFVVATTPLSGTSSPLVRVEADDLETQARDLEFVIERVRRFAFVSPERFGVLGFDMGGMVGVILAMRNPDVDAFASLDAGILYPHSSGLPASSPSYNPLALRVPWLHVTETQRATPSPGSDAPSLFERAVLANRYLMTIDGIGHEELRAMRSFRIGVRCRSTGRLRRRRTRRATSSWPSRC